MEACDIDEAGSSTARAWVLLHWKKDTNSTSSRIVPNCSDSESHAIKDTASRDTTTVYRIRRSREGILAKEQYMSKPSKLIKIRKRLEESSKSRSRIRSSANRLQSATCASPRESEKITTSSVFKPKKKLLESDLVLCENEISAELQAIKKESSDFQNKGWQFEVEKVAATERSQVSRNYHSNRFDTKGVVVQTKAEVAITQWLGLLNQKLEEIAKKYSYKPTQAVQLSETLKSSQVTRALKKGMSLEIVEQFLALEQSYASVNEAVKRHIRRQVTHFDRAIQNVRKQHQSQLQHVVEESLAELKLVRGRYKRKESRLEEEVRTANLALEQWKQSAAEAEHRRKLDQDMYELQLVAAKEQHALICQRYEDDFTHLRNQFEIVQIERKHVLSQHRNTHEVILHAKKGAIVLERQCIALRKQHEIAQELHENEIRVLQDDIQKLQETNSDMEAQYSKDKHMLNGAIEKLKTLHQREMQQVEARVRIDTEEQVIRNLFPEMQASLRREHEESLQALMLKHKRQLVQMEERLDKTMNAVSASICAIEAQSDFHIINDKGNRVKRLSNIDTKFQELPSLISASNCKYESCHLEDAFIKSRRDDDPSKNSLSNQSDLSLRSGKSRSRARALHASSCNSKNSASSCIASNASLNGDSLVATHKTWDSASLTFKDTLDDLTSSLQTTPRRSTHQKLTPKTTSK
ncbi:hypothetical protein CCR75_005788 [Bremia lactucae]|uniref:Uncharacterized protein n=1 Tax=Bremia lactucae TaxID=4779 RepID=A0A976FH79_BRELC|nr:hypothetical protein CCR75_005788 [Bremia lactucae]